MSIVLEALEKAQRSGIERRPSPLVTEKKPVPPFSPRIRSRRRLFILVFIFFIGAMNLVFIGWWLNRTNPAISIEIPTVPKIISSRASPSINVTGVVWDQKQPIALVNGKFLKKGDEILGARIIDIQLNEVRFLYKDKEFAIPIE